MAKHFQKHQNKKKIIALFVTLLAIAVPMIRLNGIHLLLFNFYDNRFEFFFRAWEVNSIGLITIFFIFAVAVILLFNFTYSRYFCGHICPKTILKNLFTDIIEAKIFKIVRIKNRQEEKNFQKNKLKTFFAYLLLAVVVLFGSMPLFFYFMPYEIFFSMLANYFEGYRFLLYIWLSSAVYLFAEILFFKEFFCSYICPYQLVNSISVNEKRGFYNFYQKEKCIDCEACVRVCPVEGLDVRNGFDSRCIACGDCSAVCRDVMENEGFKESLIEYKDFSNKNSSHSLSFADRKVSLLLIVLVLAGSYFAISYLLSYEHLSSCSFSNAFLYR